MRLLETTKPATLRACACCPRACPWRPRGVVRGVVLATVRNPLETDAIDVHCRTSAPQHREIAKERRHTQHRVVLSLAIPVRWQPPKSILEPRVHFMTRMPRKAVRRVDKRYVAVQPLLHIDREKRTCSGANYESRGRAAIHEGIVAQPRGTDVVPRRAVCWYGHDAERELCDRRPHAASGHVW